MVEALLAIPVLLLLATVAFQLFLLACAQIQLSHAAFYAARVASVRGVGATDEMGAVVRGILRTGFAPLSLTGAGIGIEILPVPPRPEGREAAGSGRDALEMVRVRVSWDYPLLLPLAGRLLSPARGGIVLSGVPTIRLTSVWSMPAQAVAAEEPGRG